MATDILYTFASFFRTILCVLSLTLIFKYVAVKFRRDPRFVKFAASLPGPLDFPLIGNGLEFLFYEFDDADKIFSSYNEKYGSIYRMWMGKQLVVGISDIEHVEAVFRNPKVLAKPADLYQAFNEVWHNGVFTAPMHIWRRTRKRLQPMFSKSVVKFQIPLINKSIDKYVELMKNEIDGPEFDLNNYMPFLAIDSFFRIHFDMNLTREQSQNLGLHHIVQIFGKYGSMYIFVPWMRINLIRHRYFKTSITYATENIKKFINMIKDIKLPEAEENWDVKEMKIETIAKSLISTTKQLQDELKIDDYLCSEIGILTSAAAETTSVSVSFFLLSVSMYPKIQEKLYDELCQVFDPKDDRPATADDISRLPYLDQVVKETHRRFTLVPFIFREVEEDIKIGSMIVPSGTTLLIRIRDIHLNPDLYPNPYEFNPGNFSPEAISRRSKYSLIPYSAGTRDCIAKNYSETAMKLVLIGLLRNFKFSTTTDMEDIKYAIGCTMGKRGGYWVRITSRRQ